MTTTTKQKISRAALLLVLLGWLGWGAGCKQADDKPAASAAPADPQAAELYRRCREAIAKDLHYSAPVKGDEQAIRDRGYRSFLLTGEDGAQFSCDVAPDRTYTLKVAPKGMRRFQDGSTGKF